jgi:hypothetical protein
LVGASAALDTAFHARVDPVAIVQVSITAVVNAIRAIVKPIIASLRSIFTPLGARIGPPIRVSLNSAACVRVDLNATGVHVHAAAAIGIFSNSHVCSGRRYASSAGVNLNIRLLSVCPTGHGENQRRRRQEQFRSHCVFSLFEPVVAQLRP